MEDKTKIPTEQPNVINKLLNAVAPETKLSTDGTALDCAAVSRGSGIGATSKPVLVLSYGGGTNSTAMLIGLVERGIKPDHILFADTGGEKQGTYHYINYFNNWLYQHDFPLIETVKYKTRHGTNLTLEQDIIDHQTLPAIAFGFKTCSQKFKIAPQEKFINERYPNSQIIHLIGYDASEARRVKENPLPNHINQFPLIEWGWNRDRCVQEILNAKLCLPGKSSCFFCPNMTKHEILDLSEEEKKRVKIIEANAKNKVELKGLGRRFSWTELIDADESQTKMFDDLEMYPSPCECTD